MGYFPCILSWISFYLYPVDLIQDFCQYWKERLTDDYHVLFYFGIRIEVEDANERIFLWGQMQTEIFPLGSGSGSRVDLLHDFSLSVQTCLFFCCCFFAFKLVHSAHGEMQWQKLAERKSPEIAKLTTRSIVFFKGRINEIFVTY